MGYYTEYFSTLLKGLGPTAFKVRWGAKRLVREVKQEDALIYKDIINLIKEHKVTKGIRKMNELKGKIKKSVHRAQSLIFNVITVDRQAIKAEKDVLDALKELSKEAGKFGRNNAKLLLELEEAIAKALAEETRKGIAGEREEYKLIMGVINDAAKDKEEFMSKFRLAFQRISSQTYFARWAMRDEIMSEKKDVLLLESIAKKIRVYIERVKRGAHTTRPQEQIIKELKEDYDRILAAVRDFFRESYLIKKRDLLLVIKILVNVNILMQQLEKWRRDHYIPGKDADDLTEFLEKEVRGKLEQSFLPIAQGFRILIHDAEEDYKEAQQIIGRDIALAQQSLARA